MSSDGRQNISSNSTISCNAEQINSEAKFNWIGAVLQATSVIQRRETESKINQDVCRWYWLEMVSELSVLCFTEDAIWIKSRWNCINSWTAEYSKCMLCSPVITIWWAFVQRRRFSLERCFCCFADKHTFWCACPELVFSYLASLGRQHQSVSFASGLWSVVSFNSLWAMYCCSPSICQQRAAFWTKNTVYYFKGICFDYLN